LGCPENGAFGLIVATGVGTFIRSIHGYSK
jgi:hypothetical protein